MDLHVKKIKAYQLFLAIYIIGGISAFAISLRMGMNREQIGFAFFIVSVLLVVMVYISKNYAMVLKVVNRRLFKISVIAWSLIFLTFLTFHFNSLVNYYLSLEYFLLVTILTLIISFQILSTVKFTRLIVYTILAEIMILSFYLGASLLFLFPAPYGNDAIVHVPYITSILSSGNLHSDIYARHYQVYPVYHLIYTGIMLLSGLSLEWAELVFLFIQIMFTFFIYLLSKKIFHQKTALLAFLVINFSTQFIIPRYSFYPSNFFIILFMMLIFMLFYFNRNKITLNYIGENEPENLPPQGIYLILKSQGSRVIRSVTNINISNFEIVVYILILTMNFSHPVLALITTCSMAFIYIVSWITRSSGIINLKMVLWSAILMLLQWIRPYYDSDDKSLFSFFLQLFSGTLSEKQTVTQATLSPYYNWIDVVLYELGFVILIMLGVCGALWILREVDKNHYKYDDNAGIKKILAYFSLLITPLPYVLAILVPDFLPDRLFIYITLFIGVFAAVTLVAFYDLSNNHIFKLMIIFAVPVLIFFSITSPTSNPNSHIYSQDLASRASLTHTDIGGLDFVRQYIDQTDIVANTAYAERITLIPNDYSTYLDPSKTYTDKFLIVRDYDMKKGFTIALFGKGGKLKEIIKPNETFLNYTYNLNKLYENGGVRAFR